MIVLADLSTGGSDLSEFKTRSRNSPLVPIFFVIFVCVLLYRSKVFLKIVAMIIRIEQDGNGS